MRVCCHAFYRDLLGWDVEPEGDGCRSVRNAGADNGGLLASPGRPGWLVRFHVADADQSAANPETAGAVVVVTGAALIAAS